jgi:hypothetical protein
MRTIRPSAPRLAAASLAGAAATLTCAAFGLAQMPPNKQVSFVSGVATTVPSRLDRAPQSSSWHFILVDARGAAYEVLCPNNLQYVVRWLLQSAPQTETVLRPDVALDILRAGPTQVSLAMPRNSDFCKFPEPCIYCPSTVVLQRGEARKPPPWQEYFYDDLQIGVASPERLTQYGPGYIAAMVGDYGISVEVIDQPEAGTGSASAGDLLSRFVDENGARALKDGKVVQRTSFGRNAGV